MKDKKLKILRVTMTVDYAIDVYDDQRTEVNGWKIKDVIKDWFKGGALNSHHASREGYEVGYSRKYIKHEIL